MMKRIMLMGAVLAVCMSVVRAESNGILKKPIPDKLIVLTFDDGCASGYTVVAPILKSLGFNGTFYVCDFDSFKTRKDWYLTWRQMIEMDRQGFEIGNHTVGHGGSLSAFQAMEDELFANNGPRMTTVCWPLYGVAWNICPDLSEGGYTFGRGGHERPYRPTVDNPFDVPSFTLTERQPIEAFVQKAQQACQGRVVVFCFHGVPDMEHGAVGVEPETFKVMMQYLKDNNYTVIAMRDLADYIDPVKAAKLSPPKEVKPEEPFLTNKDDKPVGVVVKVAKPDSKTEKKPVTRTSNSEHRTSNAEVADKANAFVWKKAEAGNWSEGSHWSNHLAKGSAPMAAGQPDYVLSFTAAGKYTVTHDLNESFLLNQLNLNVGNGQALKLAGKGLKFGGTQPSINQVAGFTSDTIAVPVNLASDLAVNLIAGGGRVSMDGLISGTGCLIDNGGNGNESNDLNGGPNQHYSTLSVNCPSNTYSGGTVINGGTLRLGSNSALGPGPVTLNGNTQIAGHRVNFNMLGGGMSGPGGFTQIGTWEAFGRGNDGGVFLWGTNTYAGPTIVHQGTLFVKKAVALYQADPAQWTPKKITIHPAATLVVSAGGPGEFSGAQADALLKSLAGAVTENGQMSGSVFCLDTANAIVPVVISSDISDSTGPGGGAFLIKKCGAGTLQLSGKNSYTGQTILEDGTLSVSSFNSFTKGKGKASSSLGAPTDIEAAEIVIGEQAKDGECALIYTGAGETSDRVMNLAAKKLTVTFDQSGTGLLKLTSTFVISGYGADKTIVLAGDTAGAGELAGAIVNPYDRAGKATTSVVKSGSGTWTLSGTNTYTGQTTIKQGTLLIASAKSLGHKTDVAISEGATLELNLKGEMQIAKLSLDGKLQPAGTYSATTAPKFIKGTGILAVRP